MSRLEFSPAAARDFVDISSYIAADDPGRAATFVEKLELRCLSLLDFPNAGRARPELAPNLRSVPEGSYVIFYSSSADALRIQRILHGARDLPPLFKERSDDGSP